MDACLLVSPGAVATLAPAARSRTSVRRSWLAGGDSSTRSSTPRPLTMITSSSFTAPVPTSCLTTRPRACLYTNDTPPSEPRASSGTNSASATLSVSIAFPVVMPGRSVESDCSTCTFTSNTFASALGRCSPTFATLVTLPEALGGIGVQRDPHGLPHRHLADVDLVDIRHRLHVGEVGKLGDPGIPGVHLGTGRPFLAVPFFRIDDHAWRGRLDGEPGHEILHRLEQAALPGNFRSDFAHLGLRLLGLRLVVRLGLRQRALGLLVIDLRLALDSGRLVDGLLLGEPLLLEPELHRANVLPRRGKVERRVEHRLLVLRLRLLQGEGHFLEFRGDA